MDQNGLLYTKLKMFHYKDKVDSLPREVNTIMTPIHIRIKPTNICNHNCWYCAYKANNLQLGQDMSARDFIPQGKITEIIDDCVEMGVKAVTFSGGGDPFCYPYLLDAAKKLSKTPIKFSALTNGSRLEGEIADIFSQFGTWLRISMDGWDGESYAEYRGVGKEEFGKVMHNLKAFKQRDGKCYLGVVIVVDKKNASHVYDFTKQLKEAGVDSVKISPCVVSNSGKENNEYHRPLMKQVKEQIQRSRTDLADDTFEIYDSYHELEEGYEKEYSWCPYLQILPVIGADLNIYPCQDKAYNFKEGLLSSIKDKRLKDFWYSDKNNFFKINPSRVCNHHCVAHAKNKMILEYLNTDREHLEFV
ncbi:radical SAM protein [Candidatus Omnitrophota bacterium]